MTALNVIKRKHLVASTERPVYLGSKLVGVYVRLGVRFFAAFDEHGAWLGDRKRSSRARNEILRQHELNGDADRTARLKFEKANPHSDAGGKTYFLPTNMQQEQAGEPIADRGGPSK